MFSLNGVIVQVVLKDPIDSSYSKKIIYREMSPDKQHELIVYKYDKPGKKRDLLNVSVINKNDSIPKFGNFFLNSERHSIVGISWHTADTIVFRLSKISYFPIKFYLVENRPSIKVRVQFDETDKKNIESWE
jgi:hypothetical protein